MILCRLKTFWVLSSSLLFLTSIQCYGEEQNPWQGWSLLAYHGRTTHTVFRKLIVLGKPRSFDTQITSIEIAKKIDSWSAKRFQFEMASNLTRRWQNNFQKDFYEGNLFIMFRWNDFPWNHWIKTTIGLGEGISYAHRVPYRERSDETNSKKTSRLLNFLAWDITLSLAKFPHWAMVYRIHHRSGIWGVYRGVSGGSNVYAWGLKYIF